MKTLSYRNIKNSLFKEFGENLKSQLDWPQFKGSREFFVACDYAGEHKESSYFTVSFLIGKYDQLGEFDFRRNEIRDESGIGKRCFSFKTIFHDKRLKNVATKFLRASDMIDGVLINFSINKEIEKLFTDQESIKTVYIDKWNTKDVNKLLWTVHLGAFLIASLSEPEQDIFWITDDDNIIANVNRKKQLASYFGGILIKYLDHKVGDFVIVVPEKEKQLHTEDLLSIPDLAGGALSFINTKYRLDNLDLELDKDEVPFPESITEKVHFLLDWFAEKDCSLRKYSFRFEKSDQHDKSLKIYKEGI